MDEDNELMKDVAARDRQAVKILYERHVEFVFRVAYTFLFDEDDARDITQSVFVALMESAHRYSPAAKFTTWLYRIVANRCLNHRSKARRRLRGSQPDRDILEQIPASEEARPDRCLERAERVARVRRALLKLPERQRLAVVLRHFEEMRYEEIATALGCSKRSVESLLFRARQSLRTILSE